MPLPLVPVVLGAIGLATLAGLVTYYLTSNKAKQDAAKYREKVNKALGLLKSRTEDLERNLVELKHAAARWRSQSDRSEEALERAQRAEALVDGLREEIDRLEEEKAALEREREAAQGLEDAVRVGLSAGSVVRAATALRASVVLRSHGSDSDAAVADIERRTTLLDDRTTALLVQVAVVLAETKQP